MANMFQQITDEKIQKAKHRETILGRKEKKQSSKEERSDILQKKESPVTNIQQQPPPLPIKFTPPPPLPPPPSKQTLETKNKPPVVSSIPVLVSISPQAPVSPLPLPIVLDMTVTSGPMPITSQLVPISVDTDPGTATAPLFHHKVNREFLRINNS